MIDTHTHLSDPTFDEDLDLVLARARQNGVEAFISPATSLVDAQKVELITKRYPDVYGLVGIYPGEAKAGLWEYELKQIREILVNNKKIVGVGEIGLDEKSYTQNPEQEELVFETQLKLALELDYPVVIHSRGTEEPMREIMEKYVRLPRGQFHCFSGSASWLDYVLERGFYVGFDGNVTYKSAMELRELAKRVPKNRLLLETDSPYLPPQGKRGERNESANVKITAGFLAQLRGESMEELVVATSANARKLFLI